MTRRKHGRQVIVGGLRSLQTSAPAVRPRDDQQDPLARKTYLNAEECRVYLSKKTVRAVYEWARRKGLHRCGGRGEWLVMRRDVDDAVQRGREAWHARKGNARWAS